MRTLSSIGAGPSIAAEGATQHPRNHSGERSSRVQVSSPLEPRESQQATTSGETDASRGSNLNEEELARDGRPRFPDRDRSSRGGSHAGDSFDEQRRERET